MSNIRTREVSKDLIDELKILNAWETLRDEVETLDVVLVPVDPDTAIRYFNTSLQQLIVFSSTKRGFDYWWDIDTKLKQASRALDVAKNILNP